MNTQLIRAPERREDWGSATDGSTTPISIQENNSCTFCIDRAPKNIFCGSELMLEGWCFANNEEALPPIAGTVRVYPFLTGTNSGLTSDRFHYEVSARRLKRPDVQAVYPHEPTAANSGFLWKFKVAAHAVYEISLFAETLRSGRVLLDQRKVTVLAPQQIDNAYPASQVHRCLEHLSQNLEPADFQIYLDLPRGCETPQETFYVYGWCRRFDGQHISGIRAKIGDNYFPFNYGLSRVDVYEYHSGKPGSYNCGFEGVVTSPFLPASIAFEAEVFGRWADVGIILVRKFALLPLAVKSFRRCAAHIIRGTIQRCRSRKRREVLRRVPVSTAWSRVKTILSQDLVPQVAHILSPAVYGNFYQYTPGSIIEEKFPKDYSLHSLSLPKITIVTPSFNQGDFLKATIESVLGQDGVTVDYIVMDGGSSDGSPEIIREYENRLKFWTSRKDDGQSAAVVQGFQLADCGPDDIMAYLNSDDILMPGVLRFVAEYFHRHPAVDVVYGHRVIINRHGLETGRWHTPRHNSKVLFFVDLIPQETLFWRRRIYDKVGGLNPSFRFALDWDLLVRFVQAGARMKRLPYFMGCFRVHQDSKTIQQSASVGALECEQLRQYLHGRVVPQNELQRYFSHAQIEGCILAWLWSKGLRC